MSTMMNNSPASSSDSMEQSTSELSSEESGRGCRSKKKQLDPACCPVCSVTLRQNELDSHLVTELDRLTKLSVPKQRRSLKQTCPHSGPSASTSDAVAKDWETYQKVRSNRQGRLKVKSKKRKLDEVCCPVCNKMTSEDISLHVEMCLERMGSINDSDDENIDVEGVESGRFDEYEWAGQRRVRASSLLEGGFNAVGMATSVSKVSPDEEDSDVIVDGDDSQVYGLPQYSEDDLEARRLSSDETTDEEEVPTSFSDNLSNEDLSRMLTREWDQTKWEPTTPAERKKYAHSNTSLSPPREDSQEVVDSLKSRIRELEARDQNRDMYKCLICMEVYNTPVVSVCCWHVHCEQCWLQTLAAKKLCPQCNMITASTDLRRIYI